MLLITMAPLWFEVSGEAAPATSGGPAARERAPAVAGQFYPAERGALEAEMDAALARARAPLGARPVALVAPHAGYVFCGRVMAEAWRQAEPHRYDLIVILGTNHTAPGFDRVSVWNGGSWLTPLGPAAVDNRAAAALLASDPTDCVAYPAAHRDEHSVEVQVPWAQRLFPGVPILPVVVASAEPEACARFGKALASVVRGRNALLVASSDLSHYPAQADARAVDQATLAAVAALDPEGLRRAIAAQMRRGVPGLATCACGESPILAAMAAARELGAARGSVLAYANSGEVPGADPGRVVGYGAVAFTMEGKGDEEKIKAVPSGALSPADRKLLLARARDSIRNRLETGADPPINGCGPTLKVHRGAFVTLKRNGDLRGCIGHMAEDRTLCDVVPEMAIEAAFGDPRFAPLGKSELARCTIEISVLTPLRRVGGPADIVIGRDGVVLRKGARSAVFLPQVAVEQGWNRDTLLSELARKAGLPAEGWRGGAEFYTFQAEVFGEAESR